jgi:uncharacterized protein
MPDEFKRYVAYKLVIGDVLQGRIILDGERLKFLEIGGKNVVRVNVVANIIDKYVQEDGEKKFGSLTLDDASGQLKVKAFGEDVKKFEEFQQGDTVNIIGLIRQWNDELYVIPEVIKKKEPSYLLLRKFETDVNKKESLDDGDLKEFKGKVLSMIKKEEENGGIEISKIAEELGEDLKIVNQEIKRLLEEGVIYEPRPGKVRYLG